MHERLKYRTLEECVGVDPAVWSEHVAAFRARALDRMRSALNADDDEAAEHWRLFAHIVQLDPRDWDDYGLLDRWGSAYGSDASDCSSGCAHYRPLAGVLGADWGVCTSPISHRSGKLTFEHQGCPAFDAAAD